MATTNERPVVTGPVTGGRRGYAFGRTLLDLSRYGYEEAEFFFEGEATRYRSVAGTSLDRDGRWDVEPAGTAPFKSRVLVYRPSDPQQFNGTVVVSWNNVTAGYELFAGDTPEILEGGYAFAGVTTQRVGVHGLAHLPQGLLAWDPERYGSLSIPSDDYSYDIFTRAALAVGPERDLSTDPMGGLDVRTLIAQGGSQSAGRLATYVNAVHPLAGVFDAFLLTIYFGSGAPLEVGDEVVNIHTPDTPLDIKEALRGRNLLRDDLDEPVMVVNSELEAMSCVAVRQPDTDRFRYWEAAGTCHVSEQGLELRAPKYERDFGEPFPIADGINRVPMNPLYDAAIHHLHGWANGGPPPPSQPLIEFAGDPPEIVRDAHGIACGGIRLPQVEVPVARNSAIPLANDIFGVLYGSSVPFPVAELDRLYGDAATYLGRFEEAARAAEKAGVLLARDADALVGEARQSYPAP
jgi:hypothetical protein